MHSQEYSWFLKHLVKTYFDVYKIIRSFFMMVLLLLLKEAKQISNFVTYHFFQATRNTLLVS